MYSFVGRTRRVHTQLLFVSLFYFMGFPCLCGLTSRRSMWDLDIFKTALCVDSVLRTLLAHIFECLELNLNTVHFVFFF